MAFQTLPTLLPCFASWLISLTLKNATKRRPFSYVSWLEKACEEQKYQIRRISLPQLCLTSFRNTHLDGQQLLQFFNVIRIPFEMAAPFAKGFSTAYKRARSQDSPTPLASPPLLKATKIEEEGSQAESKIPAFLRQSQSGKPFLSSVVHTRACIALCSFFLDHPLRSDSCPS